MDAAALAWLGAGVAIGPACLGSGLGIGILVGRSTQAVARQPEALPIIQRLMILGIAFVEAIALYAFVIAILLMTKKAGG